MRNIEICKKCKYFASDFYEDYEDKRISCSMGDLHHFGDEVYKLRNVPYTCRYSLEHLVIDEKKS